LLIVFSYFDELWLRWVDSAVSLMFYGNWKAKFPNDSKNLGASVSVSRARVAGLNTWPQRVMIPL
jgi:hypothetical protein